ncbi:hypothetical protein PHYPSEUDO_003765 [Phytophthora pseudosyringae]|uniref:Myosin-like protein n=1 Tax=Phytophthora pseudosyringae TaxID=221518 RepID=A0A8T1WES2_9STRA|nr:hypothetical protein PHYPSEUDO_003765 [Phytophthora pseudosyringae]
MLLESVGRPREASGRRRRGGATTSSRESRPAKSRFSTAYIRQVDSRRQQLPPNQAELHRKAGRWPVLYFRHRLHSPAIRRPFCRLCAAHRAVTADSGRAKKAPAPRLRAHTFLRSSPARALYSEWVGRAGLSYRHSSISSGKRLSMVDLRDSRFLQDVAPPLAAPKAAESPEGTTASSDDEEGNNFSHGSSTGRPPLRAGKASADEVFLKSMLGLLNKRGYNVRDSALETSIASSSASCTRSSSITSTGSTLSSVMLALREPNHGQTPLHIAVRKGDVQVLDALLEHESIDELLDAPDFNGNSALHFAAGNWRQPTCLAITERLLEAGANVSAQNKRGLTPLAVHMLTLKIDNPTLVVKLLEAGADPNTEAEGVAVLHLAARRDLPVISGVLVAFGASMLSLNTDGLMCYEVASNRVKQLMVRSINKAPAYLPMTQRSTCMRCKSPTLINPKKAFGNLMKRVLGLHLRAHQCNCYHCGILFCSQCLKPSGAVSAIPFVRDDDDPDDKIKSCRLCEAVLLERKRKQASQHTFDMHLMGFPTSI